MSLRLTFEVCIIGLGAAGSIMANDLCESGTKVILLGARKEVTLGDFLSYKWPYQPPCRRLRGEKNELFYQGNVSTSIRYQDSDRVSVDRIRVVSGWTVHRNAVALRYATRDFKGWSVDGIEEDWPSKYEEQEPYSDRMEQMIGVCGQHDGVEVLPGGKHYLAPTSWRRSEHLLLHATAKMRIPPGGCRDVGRK